jgi:hypothetical protein
MGDYVTAIWGWDEQAQRDFHARAFNPDLWQIGPPRESWRL